MTSWLDVGMLSRASAPPLGGEHNPNLRFRASRERMLWRAFLRGLCFLQDHAFKLVSPRHKARELVTSWRNRQREARHLFVGRFTDDPFHPRRKPIRNLRFRASRERAIRESPLIVHLFS